MGDEPEHRSLAAVRAAIFPPIGLDGNPLVIDMSQPVKLAAISQEITNTEQDYRADCYDEAAAALPRILHSAHRAVVDLDNSDAYRVRAQAYQMAGRYLIQVRQLDLGLSALTASIRDAAHTGDRTSAAVAINGQG